MNIHSLEEVPSDFKPSVLGTRSDIIARILEVVPFADFTDPEWGIIATATYSIEISFGASTDIRHFAFHIRGGNAAAATVAKILDHLGMRAIDPSSPTGIFLAGPESIKSMSRWRSYLERVLNRPSQ